MITEQEAERAIDYLRDTAGKASQARANRVYMEAWVKTVKAQEQAKHAGSSVAAGEIQALTSDAYMKALDALREAVRVDEEYRFLREAANAKFEYWRSQEASRRMEAKA